MLRVRIWVESFRFGGILLLQWQGENFAHRQHFKFPTFNLYTVPVKILYLQRYSTDFRKLCFSSKMLRVNIWEECFRWRRYFTFAMARWRNFAHRQHLKFPTFNLYTVPAKILYLQRYSTDFRKLCFSSKMLRVAIWVVSFRCAGILLLQWQGEKFAHRQHLKFPTFNLYTVPAKILYLQTLYSTDFRKFLLQLEDVEGGHLGGKFQVRRYFTFAMARWKLCASTTFEISHFQPVHCASKNPISPKVFNRFSKTLLQLEDVEGGHLGGNFSVFYFYNGKVKTLRIG